MSGTHNSRRCCAEQEYIVERRGKGARDKQVTKSISDKDKDNVTGALIAIAPTRQDAVIETRWDYLPSCCQEGLPVGPRLGKA